jgi:hypothetical protein
MYNEVSAKHHKAHIHVEYAGEEAVVALDGELVEAWMEIHRDDLAANWKLLSSGEQYFKIEPLK